MIRIALYIFLFLIYPHCKVIKEDKTHQSFELEIKQFISGQLYHYNYSLKENDLEVFLIKANVRGKIKKRKVFSKNVSRNQLSKIVTACKTLFSLSDEYVVSKLGGIACEINIKMDTQTKRIRIENYHQDDVEKIFELINNELPSFKLRSNNI